MNRIVRENYPVSKLPEDLRQEFAGQKEVTLIVDGTTSAEAQQVIDDAAALAELRKTGVRGGDFSRFKHLRRANFQTSDEVNSHFGALRDEWAYRER